MPHPKASSTISLPICEISSQVSCSRSHALRGLRLSSSHCRLDFEDASMCMIFLSRPGAGTIYGSPCPSRRTACSPKIAAHGMKSGHRMTYILQLMELLGIERDRVLFEDQVGERGSCLFYAAATCCCVGVTCRVRLTVSGMIELVISNLLSLGLGTRKG